MTRQRLFAVLLFLAVFAATVLLLRDTTAVATGEARASRPDDWGVLPSGGTEVPEAPSEDAVVPITTPPGERPLDVETSVPDERDRPGRLAGNIGSARGPIPNFSFQINPPAGRILKAVSGEIEVVDLPAGTYQVAIYAEDLLAHVERALLIRPGKTTRLDVDLKPGIRPGGKVVDEVTQHGVAGVLVDFEGYVKVRTDANGFFKAPYVVPNEALTRVTVDHPDYDRLTYLKPPALDPSNMFLGLTRGSSRIEGRILNRLGIETPKEARLRLFLDCSNDKLELRREKTISTSESFAFERVQEGFYVLHADFPGTKLPARRLEFLVESQSTKYVDVAFEPGATLEGRLWARAVPIGDVRVELVNAKGASIAEVTTDKEGFFKLEGVEFGTYRIKVWLGSPWFNTEPIAVDSGDPLKLIEVDCDLQRLKG